MKKRIGNDITFTWHIFRKDGDTQVPESFADKDVEVKLISPLQRPVTIEDVTIATGVVTFTFRGKHQVTLGNYVAVLLENKGEDGMVTLDVVSAVTLVPHSYMEEDGDDGDVIEAESVELESSISAGGGGSFVQQQADWAQTDDTAVNFILNKPDLDLYCRKDADNTHSDSVSDTYVKQVYYEGTTVLLQVDRLTVGGDSIKFYHSHRGKESKELSLQIDDVEKIKRTATEELDGLMSAADKKKLNDMEGSGTAADVSYDNTRTGLSATNVQDAIDELADTNLYETVVLTIGSADSSFSPVGQTITVTLEDGSATQYTVPMSRQITFIVQRGMRYNISGTSTDDYRVLPISVIAAIPTRYLTMRYIPIATGVFILQKDGNYYLREEYDAETMAEDAVGVLVLTSALINAGFGIVITDCVNINKRYGTAYPAVNYNDLHSGFNNSAFINTKLTDTSVAAVYVKNMSIDIEGQTMQGYIGSHAEWQIIKSNITEINNIFQTLGYNNRLYAGTTYSTVSYAGTWYNEHKWYNSNSVVGSSGNGENNENRSVVPFYYYSLN